MSLSIIVATDIHGGIGKDGKLPFYIPEDLKRFKELTTNHTIIMGRKTFESLPNGLLPNRFHIVLTRNDEEYYKKCKNKHDMSKLYIESDIDFIIEECKNSEDEYFVIGGGEVYKQFLPHCDKIYETMIYTWTEADTFFEWSSDNSKEFNLLFQTDKMLSKSGLEYRFRDLIRKDG